MPTNETVWSIQTSSNAGGLTYMDLERAYMQYTYPCDCQDDFDKYVREERKKQGIEDPPFVCEVDHSRGRKLVVNVFTSSPLAGYLR